MKVSNTVLAAVAVLSNLAFSAAECPNACSGHGVCGAKDMCTCDRNWQGSDCSLRTCPFGLSHVDIPKGDLDSSTSIENVNDSMISGSTVYPFGTTEAYPRMEDTAGNVNTNTAHDYAECSNKGLCDRKTGECECLPGYDGTSCQRASCPSDRSTKKTTGFTGNINTVFINQRGKDKNVGSIFSGESLSNVQKDECSGRGTCNTIEELALDDSNNSYELWDKEASMGCLCDPGYFGADCSQRKCKYGIDPLWIDDTTARVTQTAVRFETSVSDTLSGEYALKFFDVFGEDYITEPLDLSSTGLNHCDAVENALLSLPDNAVPTIECNLAAINADFGFEYVLTFTGNPGKLRELEIVEKLDGSQSTVSVSSGVYTASTYTKVNGEFVDNFSEKCEGVTLKVLVDSDDITNVWGVDVRPGSIGYLTDLDSQEVRLLKACLGHSDYDADNNVDVANWDEGTVMEADGSGPVTTYKMIGAFPHAVKVVPKDAYTHFVPGEYYLVWYDSTASTGKEFRVANANNNANLPGEATESYVFTTKGTVQQLGYGSGTELADNTGGGSSTERIVAYFDKYSNKLYTNYDTSCENQPSSGAKNHVCVEKGAQLFIVDSCWGKGNSQAVVPVTDPFFGGTEQSCGTSSDTGVNYNTGNLYTVKKVYKRPLTSDLSTALPTEFRNINSGDSQRIVDTYVIEVDANLGWEGFKGADPENSDTAADGTTWSDNTGIVTLFHFNPSSEGSYEYISQCSNRGLCDNTAGICHCFNGYTGVDCSIQNALAVSSSPSSSP